jgi:hypothetical protein
MCVCEGESEKREDKGEEKVRGGQGRGAQTTSGPPPRGGRVVDTRASVPLEISTRKS